jgi:insecticidal toxin complex protein TccC
LLASAQTSLTLLNDIAYNAFGHVESQTAGNSCVSTHSYASEDGRLQALIARKPDSKPLQHLIYSYDPVGNVVQIEDQAQETLYANNQQVDPINRFEYDSLYQLIKASGREVAQVSTPPHLPELASLPVDSSKLLNYTQHYRYDAAGNMLELRHEALQACTRKMAVDQQSNRALPWADSETPPDLVRGFDAGGNLQSLAPGRPLYWNGPNQLASPIPNPIFTTTWASEFAKPQLRRRGRLPTPGKHVICQAWKFAPTPRPTSIWRSWSSRLDGARSVVFTG